MNRAGAGATIALAVSCFARCGKADVTPGANSASFTIDLTSSTSTALTRNGGYIIHNNVVIARTLSGQYVAASAICTHQQGQVVYNSGSNDWYCGTHGAEYNLKTGAGLNNYGRNGLKIYSTSLAGNILTIS